MTDKAQKEIKDGYAVVLQRWVSWFRGPTAEELIKEFIEVFPGKCFICSYHRYGIEHGLTDKPLENHDCIDRETN